MTPEERTAWLTARRLGLGGSDIGPIFGESEYRGEWPVWLSKVHGIDSTRDDAAMMTGRILEEAVGKWAAAQLGGSGLYEEAPQVGAEHWMRATPDYLLGCADGWEGLECKVDDWGRAADGWGPNGSDEVPADYNLQCRWYMAVCDLPVWHLGVFVRCLPAWRLYRLERDLVQERAMVDRARQWWQCHVVEREAPEIDLSKACARALALQHPKHSGGLRVATAAEEDAARVLAEVDEKWSDLGDHRDQLRNYLRSVIGDDAGIRGTWGRVKWNRPSNRLTVRIRE